MMLGRRTGAVVVAHRLSAMRLMILLLSWINVRWSKKGTNESRGPPGALLVTVQDPNNTTQCLQLFNSKLSAIVFNCRGGGGGGKCYQLQELLLFLFSFFNFIFDE
jgi:hypothetical protein